MFKRVRNSILIAILPFIIIGCSGIPVYFSLDQSLLPSHYKAVDVSVDQLNGMIRMVSSKPDSKVTIFIPSFKGDSVDPTITLIAQNIDASESSFGVENIVAMHKGLAFIPYQYQQWVAELKRRENNESLAVFASVVGALIVIDVLLDNHGSSGRGGHHSGHHFPILDVYPNSWYYTNYPHHQPNFQYWAFQPIWFDTWHGDRGYIYQMNQSQMYSSNQLSALSTASGNYLQTQLLTKNNSASGTVIFPKPKKNIDGSFSIQIRVGDDKHTFDIYLQAVTSTEQPSESTDK